MMKNTFMYSLLAPAISTQPENEHIPSHSSAPQPPFMSLASSAPPPMPVASLIPAAPPLTRTPLSQHSSPELSKGSVEKKPLTQRPAQTGNIASVIHDDVFLKKLQQRRNAIEGRDSNESLREDSRIDETKKENDYPDDKSLHAVMLRAYKNIYTSQISSDSSSSNDSGLNSNSNRSSVSGGGEMGRINPALQIKHLGEMLGLELFLDEKQQAVLVIDGKLPVSLTFYNEQWHFYGMVRHLINNEDSLSFYQKVLIKNLNELRSDIGGLCLNETAEILMYVGGPNKTVYNADELYESLNQYVQRLDALREMLE